jgi:hypothetical protein
LIIFKNMEQTETKIEYKSNLLDRGAPSLTKAQLADEAVTRATYIVDNCRKFKQPRLDRIAMYRDLYAGKVKKKYRQPFNVTLPVFAGAMDTLMAGFNDDLALQFEEQEPADYISAKKQSALWNMEVSSTSPNAKFALKTRWDRSNAMFSGRGFMTNYAQSIPNYQNNFEVYELEDAIFQPMGGGHLESHLYAGRENVIRSISQLQKGAYDQTQVKKLLDMCAKTDFFPLPEGSDASFLTKFKANGLDPAKNDYIGETVFNLVELVLTINGTRWYLLFSPWYKIWLRFEKNSVLNSADLYPFVSWATHEDNKNFLSKSYADDMYGVADAVHTLFNQELTNREKRNYNARAFDKDIFPDVAKLDQAQYRPDALVPADTKGGTRRISEGIYTFETPELRGTIDLIEFMNEASGRSVGVTDLSMGGVQNVSKKATVVFAEQQNISKRLLLRSSPYTEAMAEIGKLFIVGLKDHMPSKVALKRLGDEGVGFDPEITRLDLDTYSPLQVKIVSSSLEMRNSQLKKEARMKTLTEISADPIQSKQVNPRWLVESKLRDGGEYDDAEIAIAMDVKNYGSKEEQAYAHSAIQEILSNKTPQLYFGATTLFQEIIYDYARNNNSKISKKQYMAMMDYLTAHDEIVRENLDRKAQDQIPSQGGVPVMPGEEVPANGGGGVVPPVKPQNTITSALNSAKQQVKVGATQ